MGRVSKRISAAIGAQTIKDEILIQMQDNIQINKSFLENLSLYSFQIKKVIAQDDSPRNNGLPIVLHWIKVGTESNEIK